MRFLFCFLAAAALCSCVKEPPYQAPDTSQLETAHAYYLSMSDAAFNDFKKATYLNEYFSVYIKSEGPQETIIYEGKIKYHGNITRKDIRKSFTLKIYDQDDRDELLANFIISGSSGDHSLVRSHLAGRLFKKAGFVTAREWLVDLYINGEFYGPYNIFENINDQMFLEQRGMSVNSLYKARIYPLIFNPGTIPENAYYKKLPDDSLSFIDLHSLYASLSKETWNYPAAYVERVFDITNLVNYVAVSYMTANWDGINKNFYLYYNNALDRFQFIPWDLDLTFSPKDIAGGLPVYNNDLFERLYTSTNYRARIEACMTNVFDHAELTGMVDSLETRLGASFARSPHALILGLDLGVELDGVRQYLDMLDSVISNL